MVANLYENNPNFISSGKLAVQMGKSEASVKRMVRELGIPYTPGRKVADTVVVKDKDGKPELDKDGKPKTRKVRYSPYFIRTTAVDDILDRLLMTAEERRDLAESRKLSRLTAKTKNQLSKAAKDRATTRGK